MGKWKARVQLRCFTGPVIFSVNDLTFAMSGHKEAHYVNLVERYLKEIASPEDDPFGRGFGRGVTFSSLGYMQIRGHGVGL